MKSSLGQVLWLGLLALLLGAGCLYVPDLTRFPECGPGGSCAEGSTCLSPELRCIPNCLDCPPVGPGDAGDVDGGLKDGGMDGGGDAGQDSGVWDAGEVEDGGVDAGFDAGSLSLSPGALGYGVEGAFYTLTFEVEGGTPPYVFTHPDPLPQGMSLSAEGTFSGTPPAPGSFTVHPQVQDSSTPPLSVDAALGWEVHPLLRVAGPGLLAKAVNNLAYSETVSAHGGVPPYEFRLLEGELPGSVTLGLDGSVSGTPGGPAELDFLVEVSDSATPPQTAQRSLDFFSTGGPLVLTIMTRALPDARVGTWYEYALQTRGGNLKEWSLASGSLPDGITLEQSTGVLYGMPTDASVFTFTLKATDTLLGGPAPEQYTLTVY